MNKIFFLALVISTFLGCKNDNKSETNQNVSDIEYSKKEEALTLLKGEFVFYEEAAVLQTQSDIYGVYITDKMLELNKLATPYKTEPTDMVNVEIKGKISDTKDDKILWDHKVEIIEIIQVSQSSKKNETTIKSGN